MGTPTCSANGCDDEAIGTAHHWEIINGPVCLHHGELVKDQGGTVDPYNGEA